MKPLSVSCKPPWVTGNVRGSIKMPLYTFAFKIKFRFTPTDLYEELNLFRKIFPWQSSLIHVLKFIFGNNLPEVYPNVATA